VKSPPFVNVLTKRVNEWPFLLHEFSGSEYITCLAEDFPFRDAITETTSSLKVQPDLGLVLCHLP
jgi:hypothetical protein